MKRNKNVEHKKYPNLIKLFIGNNFNTALTSNSKAKYFNLSIYFLNVGLAREQSRCLCFHDVLATYTFIS
jgi:hypothetical protein